MRNLIFVIVFLLTACNPVDVSLSSSAYSNLKYLLQNGKSNLEYTNSNVSKIKLVFQTQDTLTEDISLGLTFISDTLSSDQIFSDFNQPFLATKNTKNFEWTLNLNSHLSASQRLKFKIKIKDFNDKIQFTPDSFDFDFSMNYAAPIFTSPEANSYINNQNYREFSVSGTCESGNTVYVNVKGHVDTTQSSPCNNGMFNLVLDLMVVPDGIQTFEASQENQYGNRSPVSEITYIKDTLVKVISVTSDSHPLKNSTSHINNFALTGLTNLAALGESETDYRVHLYSDSDCTYKLIDGAINSDTFSLNVNLTTQGQKYFAARLEEKSGSLSSCQLLSFNYYYTTRNILIGGKFDTYNSESSKNMAKLFPNGVKHTLASFDIGSGYSLSTVPQDSYVREIIPFSTKFLAI